MKTYINVFTHKNELNTELNPVDSLGAALEQISDYGYGNLQYEYTVIITDSKEAIIKELI